MIAAEIHQTHGQSSDVGFQLLSEDLINVPSYIISPLKDKNSKWII